MTEIKPNHYVLSDPHLGHERALIFRPQFATIQEHDEHIMEGIRELKNNDRLWILGDVAFTKTGLALLATAKCNKGLILGNHDIYNMSLYMDYFNKIKAIGEMNYGSDSGQKHYGSDSNMVKCIFTHIPIHPDQFSRWNLNFHGHLHNSTVNNRRYINTCCEKLDYRPKRIEELLKEHLELYWGIYD